MSSPSLLEANARAHIALEACWLDLMEALVGADRPEGPDFESALACLETLEARIFAHAALEDEQALPAYRALPEDEKVGRTEEHLEADHTILRKVLGAARRQLDALSSQGADRRQVFSVLEPFVRIQGVLEHHTQREQERFYPPLERSLDEEAAAELGRGLLRTAGVDAS